MTKLQALRDLLEKATPGPWKHDNHAWSPWVWRETPGIVDVNAGYVFKCGSREDAALIAALRNSADVLLDVVEAAVAWSKAECGGPDASTHGRTCDAEHHFQCPIEITAMRLCTTLSKLEELP